MEHATDWHSSRGYFPKNPQESSPNFASTRVFFSKMGIEATVQQSNSQKYQDI